MPAVHPSRWIRPLASGLAVIDKTGEPYFHIDATRATDTVIVTHGHADHAWPGHQHVIATPETLAIMKARYGDRFATRVTPLTGMKPCVLVMLFFIWCRQAMSLVVPRLSSIARGHAWSFQVIINANLIQHAPHLNLLPVIFSSPKPLLPFRIQPS